MAPQSLLEYDDKDVCCCNLDLLTKISEEEQLCAEDKKADEVEKSIAKQVSCTEARNEPIL